jgi:hypothetical protein
LQGGWIVLPLENASHLILSDITAKKVKSVTVTVVMLKAPHIVRRVVFEKISVDIATFDDNQLCLQLPEIAGEIFEVKLVAYRLCVYRVSPT